jgi:hypothetical protein
MTSGIKWAQFLLKGIVFPVTRSVTNYQKFKTDFAVVSEKVKVASLLDSGETYAGHSHTVGVSSVFSII